MSQKKLEKEVKELKEQTTVVQKDVTRMTKNERKSGNRIRNTGLIKALLLRN